MSSKMKKHLSRSRFLLRLGRNFFPHRKLSNRHQKLLLNSKRFSALQQTRSNFALQLQAKQKLAAFYGALPAKYLLQMFEQTVHKNARQIQPAESLFVILESRLDIVLLRSNLASSLAHSRQLISHGRINVNNIPVSSASYILTSGDTVKISRPLEPPTTTNLLFYFTQKYTTTKKLCSNLSHLEINYKTQSLVFLYNPQYIEWPLQLDLALLARYFQRR